MIRIQFVNSNGAGYANQLEVQPNTTIAQFFANQLPGQSANNYLIRVNREMTRPDYVIQNGDRVTITPTKVAGAR